MNGWPNDPHALKVTKTSLEFSVEGRDLLSLPLPFESVFQSLITNDGVAECEVSPSGEPLMVPIDRRCVVGKRRLRPTTLDQFRKGRSSAVWKRW